MYDSYSQRNKHFKIVFIPKIFGYSKFFVALNGIILVNHEYSSQDKYNTPNPQHKKNNW